MSLKQMPFLYCVGYSFFFVTLLLYLLSFSIPELWVHETKQMGSSSLRHHGLFSNLRLCVGGHNRTKWDCFEMREAERKLGAFFIVLGAAMQAVACILIIYANTGGRKPAWFSVLGHPITYCGLASGVSYTGLLVYSRFSFQGENISLGGGFFINVIGVCTGYVTMVITSLNNYKTATD